jgi:homoserine kinase type II
MLMTLDIANVLKQYNIGTLESSSKAFHGFVNETNLVKTSKGQFVVRRNQRRLSEESHRYRHALIQWLNDNNFPTPPVIPTRNGDTLLTMGGRSYEVFPFIDGVDYDSVHPNQLYSVGETLAHYHDLTTDFPAPIGEQRPRYSAQDVMALSERLLERDMMGDLYDDLMWYDMRAAQIRAIITNDVYTRLPHVVVHGDVHRDNFLFRNDEVVALLDFDQAVWDARISDLADAIVGFASECSNHLMFSSWGVYKGPINEDCSTRLLAAYGTVSPLTRAEIMLLPLMIELHWMQGELGRVFSTPEGAPDYHLSVLQQGRWLSQWLANMTETLLTRWSHTETTPQKRLRASAA